MENLPPGPLYYSKAISMLCESATRYEHSVKRKTILEMINQEHQRRINIEVMKQGRMENIFRNKSNNKYDLTNTQQLMREALFEKKCRNNMLRQMCQKSIEESRRTEFEKRRQSASRIKALIQEKHKESRRNKEQQMHRSFMSIREKYLGGKESIQRRHEKNKMFRTTVIQRNKSEVMGMLMKAKKYSHLAKTLTDSFSQINLSHSIHA